MKIISICIMAFGFALAIMGCNPTKEEVKKVYVTEAPGWSDEVYDTMPEILKVYKYILEEKDFPYDMVDIEPQIMWDSISPVNGRRWEQIRYYVYADTLFQTWYEVEYYTDAKNKLDIINYIEYHCKMDSRFDIISSVLPFSKEKHFNCYVNDYNYVHYNIADEAKISIPYIEGYNPNEGLYLQQYKDNYNCLLYTSE